MAAKAPPTRSMTIAPPLPPLPAGFGQEEKTPSREVIDRLLQQFEDKVGRMATREEQDQLIVGLSAKLAAKAKMSANLPGKKTTKKKRSWKREGKKRGSKRGGGKVSKLKKKKAVPAIRDLRKRSERVSQSKQAFYFAGKLTTIGSLARFLTPSHALVAALLRVRDSRYSTQDEGIELHKSRK